MQHLEEGEIHTWLDGQSTAEQSAEIERHVGECESCAARIAEARGLVAASSRILSALDNVPSGVIPERQPVGAPASAPPQRRRRFFDLTVARAAVALLAVGAGTFAVTRVADTPTRSVATSAVQLEAVSPAETPAEADQAIASPDVPVPPVRTGAATAPGTTGGRSASEGRGFAAAAPAPPALADAREERTALPVRPAEPVATLAPQLAERSIVDPPSAPAPQQRALAPRQAQAADAVVPLGEGTDALRRARPREESAAKMAASAAAPTANASPFTGCYRMELEPLRYLDLRLTELPEERDPAARVLFLRTGAAVERARWSQLAGDSVRLDLARTSYGSVISGRLTGDTISGVTPDKREVKAIRATAASCGR